MKFISSLIAVTDMERSKAFYKDYLGLEVEVDFGANVTLTGGLSLQTLDSWHGFIGGLDVAFKGNDAELYFEAENFDDFIKGLDRLCSLCAFMGTAYSAVLRPGRAYH